MPHDLLNHLDAQQDAAVARLVEFCAIPSVSADPVFAGDVRRGAEWVASHLRASGLQADILPTAGHPAVVATAPDSMVADPAAKRVLFYGHYDVQPPDPLDLWTTGAFEPAVREGADGPALFARGACDDKGQVLCFLEALRAFHDTGTKLPGPVTVLIEGEEEVGSVNLPPFLEEHKDKLAADVCVVCDTSMWDPQTPAITYGLRGLVYFDIKLHGPARDLHSGVYGGTLANPATLLVDILGQLFDADHRITIPGFYDDVAATTDDEFAQWSRLGFKEQQFLGDVGAEPFGESGYGTLERKWARPSCDVNGLYGGYMQHGAKTVIPAFAGAKVSFRIPPNMDPHKVAEQFTRWLKSHPVGGCRWELTNFGEAWPVLTPTDSPYLQAAVRGIEQVAVAPALIRSGASIPIVADFQRILKLPPLLIGFGLNSDNIHSPDEHFGLRRFALGQKALVAVLHELAAV